jgi:hypothetical protein
MEKFTRIISLDGNYGYNSRGETFFITNDLLPTKLPCVIAYNPEWTSSLGRIEIDDKGREIYYNIQLRHADKVFQTSEQIMQYRYNTEMVIADHRQVLPNNTIADLIVL